MASPRNIKLKHVDEFRLSVRRPFHFRLSLWKPSHFRTGLERHSQTVSRRTFRIGDAFCAVRMTMPGDQLVVEVFTSGIWDDSLRNRLRNRLDNAYGLTENINGFLSKAKQVPATCAAAKELRGMRMSCPESIFEISVISLLLQNTTIQRSTQMMSNLLNHYGAVVEFDGCSLHTFFSASELSIVNELELREKCRLGYRAKYLPRFAEFFSKYDDDELRRLKAHDLIAHISTIKGVGQYTSNIITSHALRDFNTIPLDVWNRKLLSQSILGVPDTTPEVLQEHFQTLFPGNAGLAALYIIEHKYLNAPLDQLEPDDAISSSSIIR